MENNRFIVSVYVDNKAGVLTRVTAMCTRRGFNIDALTVGETERPEYSRITITMRGDKYVRAQLINQLEKLINVKKVEVLEDEPIKRELMLIKVRNESVHRNDIMTAVARLQYGQFIQQVSTLLQERNCSLKRTAHIHLHMMWTMRS